MVARSEITCIRNDLAGRNLDDPVVLDRFFNPSVQSLSDHLDAIDVALTEYSEPRSIWRRKGDAADWTSVSRERLERLFEAKQFARSRRGIPQLRGSVRTTR